MFKKDKMKFFLALISTLIIISCGDKVREEITERYDDYSKLLLVKYKGEGSNEIVVERIYYSENDDTLSLEKPLDSLKMVREYHENRKIKEEKNYKDGKKDGKWTYFHENGQIRLEENWKDGKKDGKWTWYYENGKIEYERNYKGGKGDGKWTYFHENGQIRLEENWKDGKIIKTERY